MSRQSRQQTAAAIKKPVEAVKKPVNAWRRAIDAAGAVVEKPWRRYRAAVFLTYLIVAVVAFVILAVIAKTVAYFTFDVTITRAVQTFNAGWFDAVMRVLTWIGFAPQAWMITLVVLVVPLCERSEMGDCGELSSVSSAVRRWDSASKFWSIARDPAPTW